MAHGFFPGKWRRVEPMPDLTTVKQGCRDGRFESFVELVEAIGAESPRQVVEELYPCGTGCGPVTFEHICAALEFVATYPKEKP